MFIYRKLDLVAEFTVLYRGIYTKNAFSRQLYENKGTDLEIPS